jgi:hypothetical protein
MIFHFLFSSLLIFFFFFFFFSLFCFVFLFCFFVLFFCFVCLLVCNSFNSCGDFSHFIDGHGPQLAIMLSVAPPAALPTTLFVL